MTYPPVGKEVSATEGTDSSNVIDLSKSRAAKKQHDQIVAWTLQQFQLIKNGRVVQERQWYLNLAFYFGKQYVQLLRQSAASSSTSTRLWTPPAPYYRSRPVINRTRKTIRDELARLTSNKPNVSIVPASADDRDLYAAQAGEQVWEQLYIDNRLKFIIRRAMWWTLVCGNGYIKTWWDDSKSDICFASETPFHVFCPDLRQEELEDQPFLIHAQTKSLDWVRMAFKDGMAVDGTRLDIGNAEANDLLEQSFLGMIGSQPLDKQNNVMVYEVYVKPGANSLMPEGAFYTIINNKIVQGWQTWPYSHGKFPFAKFDHIPGGKFYSTSSVEDLIPLQKEYNRTRGQIIEAKNRMAKPWLAAQRGSIDPSKITSEPGLIVEVTPGFDFPKPIPMQPLPNYVLEELDRIIQDWNDISGQHEVSKGQAPPGVTAATAISYLQERDEASMSHTFDSLEEGLEKTAHMALTLVHDYWDVPRTIKVTGIEGSFDVLTFKGSDLGDNLDVRVESGSSLPQSKAARQALVMDLMKMGFIEPQKGLEVMDMGGVNKIYEQLQIDQKQAQRENLRMSNLTPENLQEYDMQNQELLQEDPNYFGTTSQISPVTGMEEEVPNQPPLIISVNTWDNHKAHIEYHNQYRKGQAFESLSKEVQDIFEAHVQQHIAALGVEAVNQNPMIAGGVPPEMQGMLMQDQQQQGQQQSPGPEPMPQLNTGSEQ